jgi:hypothetical protein
MFGLLVLTDEQVSFVALSKQGVPLRAKADYSLEKIEATVAMSWRVCRISRTRKVVAVRRNSSCARSDIRWKDFWQSKMGEGKERHKLDSGGKKPAQTQFWEWVLGAGKILLARRRINDNVSASSLSGTDWCNMQRRQACF